MQIRYGMVSTCTCAPADCVPLMTGTGGYRIPPCYWEPCDWCLLTWPTTNHIKCLESVKLLFRVPNSGRYEHVAFRDCPLSGSQLWLIPLASLISMIPLKILRHPQAINNDRLHDAPNANSTLNQRVQLSGLSQLALWSEKCSLEL